MPTATFFQYWMQLIDVISWLNSKVIILQGAPCTKSRPRRRQGACKCTIMILPYLSLQKKNGNFRRLLYLIDFFVSLSFFVVLYPNYSKKWSKKPNLKKKEDRYEMLLQHFTVLCPMAVPSIVVIVKLHLVFNFLIE